MRCRKVWESSPPLPTMPSSFESSAPRIRCSTLRQPSQGLNLFSSTKPLGFLKVTRILLEAPRAIKFVQSTLETSNKLCHPRMTRTQPKRAKGVANAKIIHLVQVPRINIQLPEASGRRGLVATRSRTPPRAKKTYDAIDFSLSCSIPLTVCETMDVDEEIHNPKNMQTSRVSQDSTRTF